MRRVVWAADTRIKQPGFASVDAIQRPRISTDQCGILLCVHWRILHPTLGSTYAVKHKHVCRPLPTIRPEPHRPLHERRGKPGVLLDPKAWAEGAHWGGTSRLDTAGWGSQRKKNTEGSARSSGAQTSKQREEGIRQSQPLIIAIIIVIVIFIVVGLADPIQASPLWQHVQARSRGAPLCE